jgi:hypothetical protein
VSRYVSRRETVVDEVSGLEWQREVSRAIHSPASARAFCAELHLAGEGRWRLPTREELVSLVDYGRHSPAIDLAAFPDTPSELFLSSSRLAAADHAVWGVFFKFGLVSHIGVSEGYVRCVR